MHDCQYKMRKRGFKNHSMATVIGLHGFKSQNDCVSVLKKLFVKLSVFLQVLNSRRYLEECYKSPEACVDSCLIFNATAAALKV